MQSPQWPVDAPRASAKYVLRFEDVAQDGRLQLGPIVGSVGPAVWLPLLTRDPTARRLEADGIRPVFTRLVIERTEAKLEFDGVLEERGTFELAHEADAQGNVVRLYLNMWTEIEARGEVVARLFAEHVMTRLFAPPGQRRVTELPGLDTPRARYTQPPREALLEAPEGAAWLEPARRADPVETALGVMHTDRNHHVNSLVYARLFEEAALRRFAALGRPTTVLGNTLEIAFRKPLFAGDRAKIDLRAFDRGACGVFDKDGTACAYARMTFT